jgi:hypothetical protein
MKRLWLLKILHLIICIIVPQLFAVEISKDTMMVNNFYAASTPGLMNVRIDTLTLWNTTNSPITLDSMDVILNRPQDSLFQSIIEGGDEIYQISEFSRTSSITIVLHSHYNEIPLVYSKYAYYQLNDLYFSNKYLFRMYKNNPSGGPVRDSEFFPFLSFNGPDTCFIYGFVIGGCFNCPTIPRYLINFSGQVLLYYSDGSQVSFYILNNYSPEVKIRPEYKLQSIKKQPANDIFNINGQKLNRSIGNYSSGVYFGTTMDGHIEPRLLLDLHSHSGCK